MLNRRSWLVPELTELPNVFRHVTSMKHDFNKTWRKLLPRRFSHILLEVPEGIKAGKPEWKTLLIYPIWGIEVNLTRCVQHT